VGRYTLVEIEVLMVYFGVIFRGEKGGGKQELDVLLKETTWKAGATAFKINAPNQVHPSRPMTDFCKVPFHFSSIHYESISPYPLPDTVSYRKYLYPHPLPSTYTT
jgi:hypothetical protein